MCEFLEKMWIFVQACDWVRFAELEWLSQDWHFLSFSDGQTIHLGYYEHEGDAVGYDDEVCETDE